MMAMCSVEELDSEMETSAIEELGNIMIGGFLSAISDFTSIELVPRPPQLVKGSFDAVLDTFLVKQALMSDVALVFDGCFRRSSSEAGGTIVVFPSKEMQQALITKGKEWMG
jgi:chemotaxis protein CheC